MASSTLGQVALIDPSQIGKAATANTAFQAIDSMLNGELVIDVSDEGYTSPYTIPFQAGDEPAATKTALRFVLLNVTGALEAAWTAYMPSGPQRLFLVQNGTTGGQSVTVMVSGQTGVTVAPGETVLCFLDGTDVIEMPIAAATGSQPYDIGNFIDGQPSDGQVLTRFIAPRALSFPANFSGSYMVSTAGAAASAQFTLTQNGFQVGTATFAEGGVTATWASEGGNAVSFNPGDIGILTAPATADTALTNLVWALAGTR